MFRDSLEIRLLYWTYPKTWRCHFNDENPQKQKNQGGGNLALLLVLALLTGLLSGCGRNGSYGQIRDLGSPEEKTAPGPQAMGQFVEVEFPLPQGQGVKDMTTLPGGELRVALSGEGGTAYVSTTDPGRTDWAQTLTLPLQIEGGVEVEAVALSPTGDIFYSTRKDSGGTFEFHFWVFTAAGEAREIPITYPEVDNTRGMLAYTCGFTESGKLRVLFYGQDLREVDLETGALSENLNDAMAVATGMDCAGENSYLLNVMDGTGASCGPEGSETLSGVMGEQVLASLQASGGNEPKITLWQNPDGYLFYTTEEGLFSYIPGGSIVEELVSGGRSTLGNPDFRPKALTGASDGTFYVLGYLGSRPALYRYGYDATVPTAGLGGTLKVYSLYEFENITLPQIINQYQIAHPEVTVELEIGLTGKDGVTEADAMRTLNTQILAGEGPDVINLDGFHLETFLEKDLLMDLSGVLAQGEPLLDQVAKCYEADGKVCAVPTFFNIPAIYGPEHIVSQIQDLDSLVAALIQANEENTEAQGLLNAFPAFEMVDEFYDSCSAAWMNPDGTIDGEKLEAFYAAMRDIYALDETFRQEQWDNISHRLEPNFDLGEFTPITGGYLVASGRQYMSAGDLYGMSTIAYCMHGADQLNSYALAQLNAQAPHSFMPRQVMGVLTTSTNQATAADFVAFALTDAAQKNAVAAGFPVNQTSFDRQINEQGSNYGWSEYGEILYPAPEVRQQVKAWTEALTTPALTDRTIRRMILAQVDPCCDGEITPQEAAQNALSSLNLYLAE